jgi:hypothetical protein
VDRYAIPAEVRGCFWGDAQGAKLNADGGSIPDYGSTGGGADAEEEALALWAVLYTDPWYELRLLRQWPARTETVLGEVAPSILLRRSIEEFRPSGELLQHLDDLGLVVRFTEAVRALLDAPEFDQAAATAPADPLEHRRAIARALVARTVMAAEPMPDGAHRDQLADRVAGELHGYGLGISDLVRHPVRGLALYAATHYATRRRGAITDAVSPFPGDVLRYLAQSAGVRAFVRAHIDDVPHGDVYLLAHSLGGIICADLLISEAIPRVAGLITVGTQAPFLYEIRALPSLVHPAPLPAHVPPWLNLYDRRDLLSYVGSAVLGDRVRDVPVDNQQPFPQAHTSYWTNREVWAAVAGFLR